MNICMFSRILPIHSPGGMQDHVQTLSVGLARRGHNLTLITTARADGKEFDIIDGVQIYFLKNTPTGQNTNAYWFGAADKFNELARTQAFDVLHSQSVGAYGVYKRGLHRKYRLPLIASFHGTHLDVFTTSLHTDFGLANPVGTLRFFALTANLAFRYGYRDLWFTRAADVLIATSDADVQKYQMLYRVDAAKIRKVYNGIDANLFSPAQPDAALRAQLEIGGDKKIILALARLEKDKGVQNAVAVMPQILAQIPAVLIIVGDGEYRHALEELAHKLDVAEHVRFVGAQSLAECARYFNLSDIFVDPTLRTDGYDLTIAEAMACAKPVIVSDVGANATLIDRATQREGILIPRGDNAALAREMIRILRDPGLSMEMGKIAREKIATQFSVDAMVRGMEKVYEEFAQ